MLSRLVFSKNDLFFFFLTAGYLFGVILYDFLEFKYTDELMALFLVLFSGIVVWERKEWKEAIPLGILFAVFLFYTVYSFLIHSNVYQAIIKDLIIQIKPYLGFYCAYLIAPHFSVTRKRRIAILCLVVGGLILMVGITGNIYFVFGHPSRFATAITATAFLFLYCSSYEWSDILIFILLLTIGFFSTRTKFYGFWMIAFAILVYSKAGGKLRLNKSTIGVSIVVLILVLWFCKDKIILYYVDGMMNSREMWSRPAMLLTSGRILYDYFPFGSGLASFGTFASGEYYSALYEAYGIDQLWGLSRNTRFFICDAFYPSLAQFGVAGIGLYLLFWWSILQKGYHWLSAENQKQWILLLFSFLFFLIEGTADTTIVHNRGLFILIVTAITLNEMKPCHETEGRYV